MSDQSAQQGKVLPLPPAGTATKQPQPVTAVSHPVKESEPIKSAEPLQTITSEAEIAPEVTKAGVQVLKETIELPPDLAKLGVAPSGTGAVITAAVPAQVVLPLSDDQVVVGLHQKVTSALRWLAAWCVKKLKKAHIVLKTVHGRIVRVKI